jgi:SAM-dependent methyltransferase
MSVLDAGCGTGGSLQQLKRFGEVTAFDFWPPAAEMYQTRERGRIMVASTDAIPFKDEAFDLVTSFDVICQLEAPADQAALNELARVMKPGGTLLVRTPAIQALYGSHDRTLHTKHRYTTGEMAAKMRAAGLEVLETTYANTILFPVALARRLFARLTHKPPGESDVRGVPEPLNKALTAVLAAEAKIIEHTRLPIGLSEIALARKPLRPGASSQ